jgi:hypothetical protein
LCYISSYVIIGGVVVGASWYLKRLATGPTGALRYPWLWGRC